MKTGNASRRYASQSVPASTSWSTATRTLRCRRHDALQGSLQPTGFTVVVPNRKVMEQGAGIAKRDPRIARVRTVNTPNGAQITFQFKDGVPAYRARLRRDFIEILVGASEPKKAEKVVEPKKSDKASVAAKDKSKSKPASKTHAK